MSKWKTITLGDFIDVITDYHSNGAYENLKENVTLKYEPDFAIMIRTLNFESNDFRNNLIYLNEFEYNYLSKSKVKPHDLIMNKIANPGSVYLMPKLNQPVSLAMNLFLIRFNERLNQKFMFYLMKMNESYIKRFANGTTTKTITKDAVRKLNFKVPDLSIQEQIASLLYALDSKIELNNKINTELESLAKTIYDYWFVQFDFPNADGKPYKSSGGEMVYNKELKRAIPAGWEVGTLRNWIDFKRGISYKSSDIQDTGIPMLNLNSFTLAGKFKPEGIKYFNGSFKETSKLNHGDLVIAITDVTRNATIIGKAFIVPDLFEEQPLISCDVACVISKSDFDNYYLEMLFNSEQYHEYIKHFASGTLVLHLDLNGMLWFQTFMPPKYLLDKFAKFKQGIIEKQTINIKENQQLTQLRDWLLPMLMNGQISIK